MFMKAGAPAPTPRNTASKPFSFMSCGTVKVLPMTLLVSIFTPMSVSPFTSRSMMSRGRRKGGMPYWSTPPTTWSASKTVTSAPNFTRSAAAARPAGPEPQIATLPSLFANFGGTAGFDLALSPTKRSRRPMPTDSTFALITHCASHCVSCGQTRPQIDGKAFASLMTSRAPSKSRTTTCLMNRGMSIDTGQPDMQVGFAHWMQRSASPRACSRVYPRFTSLKFRDRSSASRSGMCVWCGARSLIFL